MPMLSINLNPARFWTVLYQRELFGLLLGTLVCGCTPLDKDVAPPPLPSMPPAAQQSVVEIPEQPPARPAVPPVQRKKPRLAAREKPPDAVPDEVLVDPDHLIGLDPGQVHNVLGAPSRVETSELSRAWVYAADGCSFRVFFYPDFKASFRALKYTGNDDEGSPLESSDICIRHILMVKNNVPN
jgi:hypothetical protein